MSDVNHPDNEFTPQSQPFGRNVCHICGGHTFTWGTTPDSLNYDRTYAYTPGAFVFIPDSYRDLSLIERIQARIESIRARRCDTCGNIQWFVIDDDGKEKP